MVSRIPTKEELLDLLNDLPSETLEEVRRFLEFLRYKHQKSEGSEWPDDFFDRFAGSLPDFPDILSEGEYESREEIR